MTLAWILFETFMIAWLGIGLVSGGLSIKYLVKNFEFRHVSWYISLFVLVMGFIVGVISGPAMLIWHRKTGGYVLPM